MRVIQGLVSVLLIYFIGASWGVAFAGSGCEDAFEPPKPEDPQLIIGCEEIVVFLCDQSDAKASEVCISYSALESVPPRALLADLKLPLNPEITWTSDTDFEIVFNILGKIKRRSAHVDRVCDKEKLECSVTIRLDSSIKGVIAVHASVGYDGEADAMIEKDEVQVSVDAADEDSRGFFVHFDDQLRNAVVKALQDYVLKKQRGATH